jgi:hypothetical protein
MTTTGKSADDDTRAPHGPFVLRIGRLAWSHGFVYGIGGWERVFWRLWWKKKAACRNAKGKPENNESRVEN